MQTTQFLIGVNSDGTAFDSMNRKHLRAFIKAALAEWPMRGEVAAQFKEIERHVNLFSPLRGINRFPGLLEVFEGHRGNCWGQALESAKVNQSLERGQVPWCKVSPDDEASLALQRSLGLALGHVGELCSLGAPIEVSA